MDSAVSTLTDRERDVLLLAAKAYQNEEIARALGITPATVKVHVRNARLKLGGASRGAAARLVQEAFDVESAGGTPSIGSANPPIFHDSSGRHQETGLPTEVVREVSQIFPDVLAYKPARAEKRDEGLNGYGKLAIIAATALFVAMCIVLAGPVSDEFQRWANFFNHNNSRPR